MRLITPEKPTAIEGYRAAARYRIPKFLADYVEGATGTGQTSRANLADWLSHTIKVRTFGADTSDPSTSAKILGKDYSAPLILGPIGLAGALNPQYEEIGAARAAEQAGVSSIAQIDGACLNPYE